MVFIHLVHWNHRNLSFSEIGLFFICFQITSISLVLFLIFLVSFGRRSQKKEFGYWNISILWDFCQGYLVKIALFGIFFLIPRYSTGFGSIQHLFLKIQLILPKFRQTTRNNIFCVSKLLFWVSEKWPKLHIFVPRGQLETQRSMFSTWKRCLIGSMIWGYQKFYSIPPKNGFLAQKRPT